MTHRESLEKLRSSIKATYDAKIAWVDGLLALIDKDGKMPDEFVQLAQSVVQSPSQQEQPSAAAIAAPARPAVAGGLEASITSLIESLPARRRWTAKAVYELMQSRGYAFAGDRAAATNMISGVLIRMTVAGKLIRVVHGKGRTPSEYEWAERRQEVHA